MTSTGEHQALLEKILLAIEQDDVVLPTLPNIAVKIQELLDDPNVSADQIVAVLSSDPSISAQIIKGANSAIFAGRPQIKNVRDATTRLGYRQLLNLVITITMGKMLYSNHPKINRRMIEVWEHSRKVAAMSYVLASRQQNLSPDQAMLAGLLHDIGKLPLCLYIEKNHAQLEDDALETLISKCHGTIGAKLLKKWNFTQDLIEVAAEHGDIHRESSKAPQADYADVVMFANLQDRVRSQTEWGNIAAVKRLGLSEEECQTFLEHNAERLEMVQGLLSMNPNAKPRIRGGVPPSNLIDKTPPPPQPRQKMQKAKSGLLSFLLRFWK